MEALIETIRQDSTLMLIVGVGVALFLIIFLVLLISAMRVKVYRDNYRRIHAENMALSEARTRVEQELKVYKITDQKNKKEIAMAQKRIADLEQDTINYANLQTSAHQTDKELHQTQEKLDAAYGKHEALEAQLEDLQARHDKIMGENTKNRANNARLLRKLEQGKG